MSVDGNDLILHCRSCSARLRVSSQRSRVICPRCKTPLEIRSPPVSTKTKGSGGTGTVSKEPAARHMHAGFGSFLSTHWRRSHWHWSIPIIVGIIVAAAASILKPLIGIQRQLFGAAVLLACAAVSGAIYFMLRVVDYVILGRKDPTVTPRSRFGWFSHFLTAALIPLLAAIAAEYAGPPQGWFASVFPAAAISNLLGRRLHESQTSNEDPGSTQPMAAPFSADPLSDPRNPFKVVEE